MCSCLTRTRQPRPLGASHALETQIIKGSRVGRASGKKGGVAHTLQRVSQPQLRGEPALGPSLPLLLLGDEGRCWREEMLPQTERKERPQARPRSPPTPTRSPGSPSPGAVGVNPTPHTGKPLSASRGGVV